MFSSIPARTMWSVGTTSTTNNSAVWKGNTYCTYASRQQWPYLSESRGERSEVLRDIWPQRQQLPIQPASVENETLKDKLNHNLSQWTLFQLQFKIYKHCSKPLTLEIETFREANVSFLLILKVSAQTFVWYINITLWHLQYSLCQRWFVCKWGATRKTESESR